MPRAAIVILAGTDSHADLGRATNALTTVQEFAEAGDECTLIFDGAGVLWGAEMLKDDNQLHGPFEEVRDHVAGVCHFCAGAFGVPPPGSDTAVSAAHRDAATQPRAANCCNSGNGSIAVPPLCQPGAVQDS